MKILYVCTHNRCRSILAEAITMFDSDGSIQARSAGSQPSGLIHPLTLHYLQEAGVPTQGLYSKSWDKLSDFDPDVVITVCDSAAQESCPLWLGKALKLHWPLADPSKVNGGTAEIEAAFHHCIQLIKQRVSALQKLDFINKDPAILENQIKALAAQAETH